MTARELHENDRTMVGLIKEWDHNGQCPLPLADYLLENDLPLQAECAKWAASQPKRKTFQSDEFSYPYPTRLRKSKYWFYSREMNVWKNYPEKVQSDDVPADFVNSSSCDIYGTSVVDCILNLLDSWIHKEDQ